MATRPDAMHPRNQPQRMRKPAGRVSEAVTSAASAVTIPGSVPDCRASNAGGDSPLYLSALSGAQFASRGTRVAVIMQTLVLGGTAWLGGHVASAAIEREHQVTCLARGFSGAAPEGVELVRADRSRPAAYDALKPQQWDVVVDVARQPGQVRSAVRALADRAGVYVFVSSSK